MVHFPIHFHFRVYILPNIFIVFIFIHLYFFSEQEWWLKGCVGTPPWSDEEKEDPMEEYFRKTLDKENKEEENTQQEVKDGMEEYFQNAVKLLDEEKKLLEVHIPQEAKEKALGDLSDLEEVSDDDDSSPPMSSEEEANWELSSDENWPPL